MEIISRAAAKEKARKEIEKQLRTGNLKPEEMVAEELQTFQEIGDLDAFEVLLLLDLLSADFYPTAETVRYIGILDQGVSSKIAHLTHTHAEAIINFLKNLPVDIE